MKKFITFLLILTPAFLNEISAQRQYSEITSSDGNIYSVIATHSINRIFIENKSIPKEYHKPAIYRKTGETIFPELLPEASVNYNQMDSLIRTIFPDAIFTLEERDKDFHDRVCLFIFADPETMKIKEVYFSIKFGSENILSLSPDYLPLIESKIKENVCINFPLPIESYPDYVLHASYVKAKCCVNFTTLRH